MGRTPKPLTLLVDPSLEMLEGFQQLRDKGHWITSAPVSREGNPCSVWEFDAVVGPTSWRMTRDLMKYLDPMLKGLRASKYPPPPDGGRKGKKGKSDESTE